MRKRGIGLNFFLCFFVFFILSFSAWGSNYPAPAKGCISAQCHAGIEPIRAFGSGMLKQIYKKAERLNDPNGCVICHGAVTPSRQITRV